MSPSARSRSPSAVAEAEHERTNQDTRTNSGRNHRRPHPYAASDGNRTTQRRKWPDRPDELQPDLHRFPERQGSHRRPAEYVDLPEPALHLQSPGHQGRRQAVSRVDGQPRRTTTGRNRRRRNPDPPNKKSPPETRRAFTF